MTNFKKIVLASLLIPLAMPALGKDMKIAKNDNSSKITNLENVRKLTLEQGKLVVTGVDGTAEATSIADITNITFGEFTSGVSVVNKNTDKLGVYPNPCVDRISVTGFAGGRVSIQSVDGRMVWRGNVGEGETIDVSSLPNGMYILTSGNVAIKFIKR